jgi:DNA-binding transcriptional regulator YdaS (Cro superfamily)
MTPREGLEFAVSLFGSQEKLARAIKFSGRALSRAKDVGRVTAEMAFNIERATNKRVTRLMLRPDIFGNGNKLIKHSWYHRGGHRRSQRRR